MCKYNVMPEGKQWSVTLSLNLHQNLLFGYINYVFTNHKLLLGDWKNPNSLFGAVSWTYYSWFFIFILTCLTVVSISLVSTMTILVVEFLRQGYKIRKVFD